MRDKNRIRWYLDFLNLTLHSVIVLLVLAYVCVCFVGYLISKEVPKILNLTATTKTVETQHTIQKQEDSKSKVQTVDKKSTEKTTTQLNGRVSTYRPWWSSWGSFWNSFKSIFEGHNYVHTTTYDV